VHFLLLVSLLGLSLVSASVEADAPRPISSQSVKPQKLPVAVPQQPNLSLIKLELSGPIKEGDAIGSGSNFTYHIQNNGSASAPPTTIQFKCSPGCPPQLIGSRPVPGLFAGQIYISSWPNASNNTWAAGTYTLEAIVDPASQAQDADRTDNRKVLTVTVTSLRVYQGKLAVQPLSPHDQPSESLKAASAAKIYPAVLSGTGRRSASINVYANQAQNPLTGRRIANVNVSADFSMNTLVGRRVSTINIAAPAP